MTLTPAGAARRANARRNVADLLEQWGASNTADRAAQILDAVDAAGWHPPRDLTHQPEKTRPASEQARAEARAVIAAALGRTKETHDA